LQTVPEFIEEFIEENTYFVLSQSSRLISAWRNRRDKRSALISRR